MVRGDGHVAGASDVISQVEVIALRQTGVVIMGMIIGRSHTPFNDGHPVRRRKPDL